MQWKLDVERGRSLEEEALLGGVAELHAEGCVERQSTENRSNESVGRCQRDNKVPVLDLTGNLECALSLVQRGVPGESHSCCQAELLGFQATRSRLTQNQVGRAGGLSTRPRQREIALHLTRRRL